MLAVKVKLLRVRVISIEGCINVLFCAEAKPECVVNATVVISDMVRINKPQTN
jgi:hypothetical protein